MTGPAGATAGERIPSHAQEMIWVGQQLLPDVPLYNMAFAFTIEGELDPAAFGTAFARAVAAAGSMRTGFVESDGAPRRLVGPPGEAALELLDLRGEPDPAGTAQRLLAARAQRPLDLAGPLYDAALITLAPDRHVWYLNQHHLIADAWSMSLLFRQVSDAYAGGEGAPPPVPYEALVEHERSERGRQAAERARTAWAEALEAAPPPPSLYGAERRHSSSETVRVVRRLTPADAARLRAAAAAPELRGLTPDMSLFNLFATVLTAWMWRVADGQDRFGLGCVAHNRSTADFKRADGPFIELFPLFSAVEEDDTFATLNGRVRAAAMRMLQHARSGASSPAMARTFNVVLNLITATLGDFAGRPVSTEWLHCGHGDPGHHLRLQVHDLDGTGGLVVYFDFNAAVFDERQRAFAADHLWNLLEACVADPATPVAAVPLPGDAEQRLIHRASATPAPAGFGCGTAVDRFAQVVARHPGRLAVAAPDGELTYAELDARSGRLAARLRAEGAGPDRIVAVCTGRSVDMLVAIVGVLKAGAAYLPLAVGDPAARWNAVLEASGAIAVVAHAATADRVRSARLPVVMIGEGEPPGDPAPAVTELLPEHLAYVLPTSGSTGTPKAVMVEHRNLMGLVDGLHDRVYAELDRPEGLAVAMVAPYVFDPSVQQIFGALLHGHTLHVVPDEARADADALTAFLHRFAIDVADGTPAHLRLMVDGAPASLAGLAVRHFVIGGEAMPAALAARFLAACDEASPPIVTNAYGPAECCVDCLTARVSPAELARGGTVTIGTPLPGQRAYVLDAAGRQQPIGVIGELCIGGGGVGRGYAGDPELTAARFTSDPAGGRLYRTGDLARLRPDGAFEFVGRADDQVKVRGHRVEPAEVEAALKQFRVSRALMPLDGLVAPAPPARCRRCLLTAQHPGVELDGTGLCSECRRFDAFRPVVADYFGTPDDFRAVVERTSDPASPYDVMLLYSGGKDSSYVLYRLVDMGLRVLAYTFDNGHISAAAFRNIERQTGRLGVESIVSSTAHMDEIFLESLKDDATVCSGCFRALTGLSTRLASDRGIRVVVTGLSRGQIFDTKLAGLFEEGVSDPAEVDAKLRLFRRGYHARRDRTAALLDVDLADVDFDGMAFVDYFRYDDTPTAAVREFLQERDEYWRQPEDTGFCSTNCMMNDVGIAVHTATRGYHNYEAPLSWDVRLGVVSRDDALAEVAPVRNTRYVTKVLENIGYTDRRVTDAAVVVEEDGLGSAQLWAFYTAPEPLPVPELRLFLGRRLPDYMIPSRFVHIDQMPLTPNGKIDRRALRRDDRRPEIGTAATPPRTHVERALASIWEDVLGVDGVGVHDGFFDLGGDSIMAIQVVARANRQDLPIQLRDMLETLTVAGMAEAVEQARPAAAARVTGPVGLTPIQLWFLDTHGRAGTFHQIVTADAVADLDAGLLARCLLDLADHHDTLRQSFAKPGDGWTSQVAAEPVAPPLRTFDSERAARAWLEEPFDLGAAPLLRAARLRRPNGGARLILAAHHLVVDAVSWQTLVDDLGHLYRGRAGGSSPSLPPIRSSVRDWAAWLADGAGSVETGHWRAVAAAEMPVATGGRRTGQAHAARAGVDRDTTATLLGAAPGWRVGIEDLLVAALALTLSEDNGAAAQRLFLEGHGRDTAGGAPDVSRTLGWFTTLYPVVVSVPPDADPAAAALAVRDELQRASPMARDYGVARYLHPDPTVRSSVALREQDHVVFNYLGRQQGAAGGDLRIAGPLELYRGGRTPQFAAEVDAAVVDGILSIRWTSATADRAHVEGAVRRMAGHVRSIVAGFTAGRQAATPGDFPLAGLDDAGIAKLAAALKASDAGG